jgi:topoisomerase-4 subunit A
VWSAVLYDADNQGYPYVKRFLMEATKRKQNFLGENPLSKLILLTDQVYPRLQVVYGGQDEFRGSEEIDVEQFITVKGFKAKGKRLTTYQLESITELEPTRFPEPPEDAEDAEESEDADEDLDPDADKSEQQVIDEITGQTNLFDAFDQDNNEE